MSRGKNIYFLRPEGALGPIKIGCSIAPADRLKSYQIWSPVVLDLVASCGAHHNTEQFLHRHFLSAWKHGEWFDWTPEIQAVIDHVAGHGRVPEWVEDGTPTKPKEYGAFVREYPKGKTRRSDPRAAA